MRGFQGPFLSAIVFVAGVTAAPALADGSGHGTITYVNQRIGDRPIADGGLLAQNHLRGVVLGEGAGNIFHMTEQDCIGATIVAPDVPGGDSAGYCDGIDGDGDVYFVWWRSERGARTWGILGGTGKFAGLTGGGTTTIMGVTEDGRVVIAWDGKWTGPAQ